MESTAIQSIFDRDGYIALPVFITRHKVQDICREVDRFLAMQLPYLPQGIVFREDKSRPETVTQVQQLHRYDEFFHDLLEDDHFRRVAETVLKGPVTGMDVRYFDKPPGCNEPTPPHQDGAYLDLTPCDAVELWLSLDDADEETGCIRYARGSHVLGLLPHQHGNVPGFSRELVDQSPCEDERAMVACRTRAGDLLVHHALTIHWTEFNESGHKHRRALGLVYYAENSPDAGAGDEGAGVSPDADFA